MSGLTPNQLINAALTEARTDLTRMRHRREAMGIAKQRGELIHKDLVTRQAQYVFLTLRAAILAFPSKYARHVVAIPDEHQAKQILTKAAHEFLSELESFPEKAINPDWLQTLEGDGQGVADGNSLRPSSGLEIAHEQKKAGKRRAQKTQTMRNLRAKGKIA